MLRTTPSNLSSTEPDLLIENALQTLKVSYQEKVGLETVYSNKTKQNKK
jgi:hypothetical protein